MFGIDLLLDELRERKGRTDAIPNLATISLSVDVDTVSWSWQSPVH
jgi:hypothetical protein